MGWASPGFAAGAMPVLCPARLCPRGPRRFREKEEGGGAGRETATARHGGQAKPTATTRIPPMDASWRTLAHRPQGATAARLGGSRSGHDAAIAAQTKISVCEVSDRDRADEATSGSCSLILRLAPSELGRVASGCPDFRVLSAPSRLHCVGSPYGVHRSHISSWPLASIRTSDTGQRVVKVVTGA